MYSFVEMDAMISCKDMEFLTQGGRCACLSSRTLLVIKQIEVEQQAAGDGNNSQRRLILLLGFCFVDRYIGKIISTYLS